MLTDDERKASWKELRHGDEEERCEEAVIDDSYSSFLLFIFLTFFLFFLSFPSSLC